MTRKLTIATTGLAAVALVALAGPAGPASAAPDFGQHVSGCAQTMGFDGEHNPGMHTGFSGWSAEHSC